MRVLVLSDWLEQHAYLDRLPEVVRETHAEAVLFTGNILRAEARTAEWERAQKEGRDPDPDHPAVQKEHSDDAESLANFFRTLRKLEVPVCLVPGKNDAPERFFLQAAFNAEVVTGSIYMVHRSFAPLGRNYVAAGFGGEITKGERDHQWFLRYPGWEAEFSLDFLRHLDQEKILLFHTPPRENFDDSAANEGHEVVSHIINTYHPRFVVCSRGGGKQGRVWVGDTLVVCPGRWAEGDYAVLDLAERRVSFGNLR